MSTQTHEEIILNLVDRIVDDPKMRPAWRLLLRTRLFEMAGRIRELTEKIHDLERKIVELKESCYGN